MNTTGRSEGINSFFDGFVTSSTNLREFVVKYEEVLKRIIEKESDENFELEHKYWIVNDGEFLLKQASQLYTRNVFNKFKDEWSQVNRYKVEKNGCDAEFLKYLVRTKFGESEEFMVKLNPQTYEGTCDCKFVGILCRHMLKVFVRLDIDKLPNHFILPRWRQEANKFRKIDLRDFLKNDGKEELEALRLSHMCHQATKLGCVAASSNKAYFIYMDGINELARKLLDISNQPATVCQQKDDPCFSISSFQPLLLDPNISQTKGRKKDVNNTGRIKSGIELALGKKKRKCNSCGKLGHDKRIFPLNSSRKSIEISNPGKL